MCVCVCVRDRKTPGEEKASGADGLRKETVPPAAGGTAPEGLQPGARPPCPQHGPATREFPRVAPRPGRAGGCLHGGGKQPEHQNSCRLWAGAALAGSLRRASSKDGQRVRRRSRPCSPLARRPALRPGAATGGRCGTDQPPEASGRGASGTGSGRARPRRLPSPRDCRGAETMAARVPGRAERGAARGALPTPVRRPRAEGRGYPARRAARGAHESRPHARARGGTVCGRERGPAAQARGLRKPLRHRGGGGAGLEVFSRKARGFLF